jgi:hypothetical protein
MTFFPRFWAIVLMAALGLAALSVPGRAQTTALTPIRIANLGFSEASALPIYAQQNGIQQLHPI